MFRRCEFLKKKEKKRYTVDIFYSLAKHLKQLNSFALTGDKSGLLFWDFIHIGGLLRIMVFNNAEILQICSSWEGEIKKIVDPYLLT